MKTNKMKNKSLLTIGVASVMLFSCAKDELDTTAKGDGYGPARQITVTADLPLPSNKAHMDVQNLNVLWDNGDQIRINNKVLTATSVAGEKANFNEVSVSPNTGYTAGKDVYRAVFPQTLTSSIGNGSGAISVTLPESQKLIANLTDNNNYMAAISAVDNGATLVSLHFKNLSSIIKIGLKADPSATTAANTIRQIVFSAPGMNLSGNATLTFSNDLPVLAMETPTSGQYNDVSLDVTSNGQGGVELTSQYTYFYIMLPPALYNNLTMKVINVEGKAMKLTVSSKELERSKVYTVERQMAVDPGYNPYEFELCDGTRFEFAPGNLQYQASTGKWRFAQHSWDIIGGAQYYDNGSLYPGSVVTANNTTEANGRRSQSAWIDLFGWGTSGWNAGNANAGACYLPTDWHGVYDNPALKPTWNGGNGNYGCQYGPQGANNITGAYANSDWGMYNQISTYDNSVTYDEGTWRTPTKEEWECIISLANGNNWAYASVVGNGYTYTDINGNEQGLSGLLLVPKGWIDPRPNGKQFKSVIAQGHAYFSDNEYTEAEMQVLMNSGAIFLPASGTRGSYSVGDCSTVGHGGIAGMYWSSTAFGGNSAYSLRFENQTNQYGYTYDNIYDCCFVRDDNRRCFGECVRLIKTAAH